jgi:hypothetical protein
LVEGFINDDAQWDAWCKQIVDQIDTIAYNFVPDFLSHVREALADLLLGVPTETQTINPEEDELEQEDYE